MGAVVAAADSRLLLMPLEYTQIERGAHTHTGALPAARLLANGHDFIEKTHISAATANTNTNTGTIHTANKAMRTDKRHKHTHTHILAQLHSANIVPDSEPGCQATS